MPPRPEYRVELLKEQLTFCAAHFITFAGNICESLHGHNYGLRCEVRGGLTEDRYVIDFIALRDELAQIARELDHAVLLPLEHAQIQVELVPPEVVARFDDRRWVFPEADCRLLPVANTTAEELARYICERLIARLQKRPGTLDSVDSIEIGVDENQGQWGCYTVRFDRV